MTWLFEHWFAAALLLAYPRNAGAARSSRAARHSRHGGLLRRRPALLPGRHRHLVLCLLGSSNEIVSLKTAMCRTPVTR